MRKAIAAALISAAVAGIPLLAKSAAFGQAAGQQPAEQQTPIPVRQVVLYSSGVGYFEHFGQVKGNGSTELRFKTQQINDILKSLVLQDMDKGKIGVITYPSQDPIAKTLRSFQIDITANPGVPQLLAQLRGARIAITVGAQAVSGAVLGVEQKPVPVGGGKDAVVVNVWFVNLITDGGIRSVSLDDVRSLELQDPKLREELKRALAALASARDQDKKPVNINFSGDGERRIRIGYVVETPVWKTSYRLILAEKGARPVEGRPSGALQGWAIVENQTDNDWNDVQLSLVSGRPISFIMDLYQPLYIPRPVVQPELYASLRPQTYDAGTDKSREFLDFKRQAGGRADADGVELELRRNAAPVARKPAAPAGPAAMGGEAAGLAVIDPQSSVSSIVSAAKVGELFQYTVGNVTLPRQSSAMIPVVTDPIEVEKLSIYNASVLPKNPLLGARVKNTTAKHLLQGPITVLDEGAYVGDARIDDLPPGQERLVSYGVDQQILIQAQNVNQTQTLVAGKIVKGVLHLTHKQVNTQDYIAENKGDKDKTLVIEHPKFGGAWKLTEPARADETTDTHYRFKGAVAAGRGTKLTVQQELTRAEEIAILPLNTVAMLSYSRNGAIPREVRDALAKAASLKEQQANTDRAIREKQTLITQIGQEQTRIRDNMKTVAQNTEYYTRLLNKLGEQETQIEGLQKEIVGLQEKSAKERKALEDYLNGLNVG